MSKEDNLIWQERISQQIDGLQYGQVIVTVHDGQIVQIDRTERTRYPLTSGKEDGVPHSEKPKKSQLKKQIG